MNQHTPIRAPEPLDFLALLRGVLWRPWMVALLTLVGTGIAVATALMLPPVYQSTARILVEGQQIPGDLARSTVTASAAERLAIIEQRLMTRDNLLDVARRLALFDADSALSPTEKIQTLRGATRIDSISFNANPRYRGPSQVSAFTISFESRDPGQAARVANEFVSMVIEQNLVARTERATETREFFQAEVERLGAELVQVETDIATFKARNKSYLPGALEHRLTQLAALRQQVAKHSSRIKRLLEGSTPVQPVAASLTTEANTAPQAETTLEPWRQGQIDLLRLKQTASENRIVELQSAIERTTQVEMELAGLERRHGTLQAEYKDAVRKESEAATGEKLEDTRQAERFEVIEQAAIPEKPIAPKRAVVALGGALASLCIAIALAMLLEWQSKLVRSGADLERMLGVRAVAMIPVMRSRRENFQAHVRTVLALSLLLVGVSMLALAARSPEFASLGVLRDWAGSGGAFLRLIQLGLPL